MAAWQGGGGYTSRDGLNARPGAADQVQIQMDRFDYDKEVDGLREGVGRLKGMANAIHEESKVQGEIINTLEDTMERAKMGLQRATKRLNVAYRQASSCHLLWLVLFAFALFFTVYLMAKFRGLVK
mmetsp:Transcript_11986/g.21260  ORF Transcript_11986/g.21260 Transcript_11986/m.21260 type:complete len:126 (+) Transcript_11986:331-708(+)|eukprot:CAMPEP_0119103260 /NCGR_PEP_ID=MMETSP1180-20130426/1739_1 /TAXON_ID=3052 ORGANISM="Chlamydomonas cf sp, Strain CCMP681" /NCGR_SAMPLE_ID=MMETSP1180 /ASSEMBLY_ACC=CAM_ASM_000741 /LENGTH=125 /DNA_ID=CAMNT_0007087715 /DNA_START=323 /DNA_END=700 /DNA_ORIENTATION=+